MVDLKKKKVQYVEEVAIFRENERLVAEAERLAREKEEEEALLAAQKGKKKGKGKGKK